MWYFLWTNKIFVLTFIRLFFFHVAKLPNLFCMHQIIIRVWYELVSLWYEVYVGVSIFLDNPNSKSLATPFFLPCKSLFSPILRNGFITVL